VRINHNPLVLDAPDLFGSEKELYLKLKEQGAGKDVLLRVEQAMKRPPKPISRSLTIPVEKRKPVKSLEDRLWARYRSAEINREGKGKLMFNKEPKDVPLPVLLAFTSLIEEPGRFHAESRALINWQITLLSYILNGKLEPQPIGDLDEKEASQQISKFIKGVSKLANIDAGI
jgi:hypothetical protein